MIPYLNLQYSTVCGYLSRANNLETGSSCSKKIYPNTRLYRVLM